MEIRTYTAETLPLALQKAKQELGEDIILLESKEVTSRNRHLKFIQIHVGREAGDKKTSSWSPPAANSEHQAVNAYKNGREKFNDMINTILSNKPRQYEQEKQILKELTILRQNLNQLMRRGGVSEIGILPESYVKVYNEIEERGVAKDIAFMFVKRAYLLLDGNREASYEEVLRKVKAEMGRVLKPYDFSDRRRQGRQQVIMLLGSTGVGKSLTSMKMAKHPQIFGKRDVAIISTDPYGISTELKLFAQMSGITVVDAKGVEGIKTYFNSLKSKEVIIVDTPGRSPFTPGYVDELEKYVETLNPTDIFLVLSMSADVKDIFLSCGLYLLLKPTGFIFTKFDETTQPGKIFSILEEINLPTVCFCDGEKILRDVAVGNVQFMHEKIFNSD